MSTSAGRRSSSAKSAKSTKGGGAGRSSTKSKMSEEERMAKAYDDKVAKAQAKVEAAQKAFREHMDTITHPTPANGWEGFDRSQHEIYNEKPAYDLDMAKKALARAQSAPRSPAERDAQTRAKTEAATARALAAAERKAKAAERAAVKAAKQAAEGPKKPRASAKAEWQTKLTPVGRVPDRYLDPYGPPNADALAKLYGADQLRAALGRYSRAQLAQAMPIVQRHAPGRAPNPDSATKAALINYLVANVDPSRIPDE